MSSRSTDIVFLLGAGASVEAGIPMSAEMIDKIEGLLKGHVDWKRFNALYNHVKSAIHYSAGLKGQFGKLVPFNIETVVNALYELERNEEHPLYPFIASWNSRFVALAENDFANVKAFRRLILKELKRWMCPEDNSPGEYYRGFIALQRALTYPLHVFSLNYDLCLERLSSDSFHVETGFAGHGPNHLWDWERFEQALTDSGPGPLPQLFLYKLHGSINWKRDEGKNLFAVEQIENVDSDSMDVIFGRDFKLEAADPYLFYAYQFRRFTLQAKLIVAIGYGFADSHINKILTQALRSNSARKMVVVARCINDEQVLEKQQDTASILEVDTDRVHVEKGTASSFIDDSGLGSRIVTLIPEPKDSPF